MLDLSTHAVRGVILRNVPLSQIAFDTTTVRIELPRFQLEVLEPRSSATRVLWIAARITIGGWKLLRLAIDHRQATQTVVDGDLLRPSYGSLSALRFSGLRLQLSPGSVEIDGGDGRLEGVYVCG